MSPGPSLAAIQAAAVRLRAVGLQPTPLLRLPMPDQPDQAPCHLKLECLQPEVRCYKIRGALNALHHARELDPGRFEHMRTRGILTTSAGNFALGLAAASQKAQVPLTVLVPEGAAGVKLSALSRAHPTAKIVHVSWDTWWQSLQSQRWVDPSRSETPAEEPVFLSPLADPQVLAGNGTIGLELLQQLPCTRPLHVLVPFGGGGLAIGIAAALRQATARSGRRCHIWACEVDTAAPLTASWAAGRPVEVVHRPSFVDGIGARTVAADNFVQLQALLDGVLCVALDAVGAAVAELFSRCGVVTEGAGAVALAASRQLRQSVEPGADLVCILSGGNLDMTVLEGLVVNGGCQPPGPA